MLRSGSFDYSDAYIVVKERITVKGDNDAKTRNKKLLYKNNAPFRLCISKINNTIIGNGGDLDMLCPCIICIINLLGYSSNYSITSGSL